MLVAIKGIVREGIEEVVYITCDCGEEVIAYFQMMVTGDSTRIVSVGLTHNGAKLASILIYCEQDWNDSTAGALGCGLTQRLGMALEKEGQDQCAEYWRKVANTVASI